MSLKNNHADFKAAEFRSLRFCTPLLAAITVLGLAACQQEPPALALEKAKKETANFEGVSLTMPPKTIVDIEKLLASQPPADPKAGAQDRALVAARPAAAATERDLALFYQRRAEAASRLGLIKQALSDYRAADARADAVSERGLHRQIRQDQSGLEFQAGDVVAALRIRHTLSERWPKPGNRLADSVNLSRFYANSGNLEEAQKYLDQAEAAFRELPLRRSWNRNKDKWTRNIHVARMRFLRATGDLAGAERAARIALDTGRNLRDDRGEWRYDRAYGGRLNNLAAILRKRGKLLQAEIVIRDAIADSLRTQGRYSMRTAGHLRQLLLILGAQGRHKESEKIARYVFDAIQKTGISASARQLLQARRGLAFTLAGQGRWAEAAAEFAEIERAVSDQTPFLKNSLGASHVYALALVHIGRYDHAERVARGLLERYLRTLGEKFITIGFARGALAMALAGRGDRAAALKEFAKAAPILQQQFHEAGSENSSQTANDTWISMILASYIDLLARIKGTNLEEELPASVATLTFQLAQSASARSVQGALSASAARAAARNSGLATLVRQEQDGVTRIRALNGLLANAVNLSAENRDERALANLRRRIDTLRAAHATLLAAIEKGFPDYAALMNPKPVRIAAIQRTLRAGEALITTYVEENKTYVWAVPKVGKATFAVVPLGHEALGKQVNHLRRALDPQVATLGAIPAFDTKASHDLYKALLGPVEAGWKDAKSLLVVAHGPLGQLPFSVLVTEPKAPGAAKAPLFSNYRTIPFLARSHAVTALPSVASLATLRSLPPASPARRNFAGFGDPWFSSAQAIAATASTQKTQVAALTSRGLIAVRGLPVHLRSAPKLDGVSSADLAKLPRLPDTADEVRGIALAMNADLKRDVFTGRSASEGRVKSMTLSSYKVVAFATHGLVPGDLNGLTQPALALSSPKVTGGKDDGLLTMGEILGLKLDADWVVLSACNTASGNGAGAEAVSGLGRAFFYAGTRALLVSNWPVETTSAKALTTDIFKRQATDRSLSRADALRQSMLGLIEKGGLIDAKGNMVFSYAHPIFWAPFSLVGDGGGGKPAG